MTPPVAAPARTLRLLTFTTLYPNAGQPNHGIFVETRLRHLLAGAPVESTVLAPVPWFPFRAARFGAWARYAVAPRTERRHGIEVLHPRYLALPRIGMHTGPDALWVTARIALRRLIAAGRCLDAIDAHYLYPDGVVAVRLGREFGLPVAITARGSDTSLLPRFRRPGRLIREAITKADALIAVSAGLKEGLVALGADPAKVTVLRNGVDLALFHPPADRAAARAALGVQGPVLLSVGLLIPRKGHHLIIEALRDLPEATLLIAGEGPDRAALEAQAQRLGLGGRVRFLGAVPHAALPPLYGAADLLVLASEREGWANVLLEAMACGTPAIAGPAWGSREAICTPAAGVVLDALTPGAIADAARALLAAPPDRATTRAHAEGFGWDETTRGQLDLFRRLTGCGR
ncbi:glycosyltransferase [Neoroseomonas terrae]|uniref:glycosyltransferase n=1 Tax=Neoroseomonas terrae TaxID=424799 RepID=UPI0030B9ADC0